jgi:putative two-component system response regulator
MVQRATILAVDDDPSSLLLLTNVLKLNTNFNVLTATNVADGMVVAERHVPDLVITDRVMPGKDGFDFCRWIKGHPDLSITMVMMLTASGEISSLVKGFELGADDYLVKPFNPEELHSRVRSLLRIKLLGDQLKTDNARLAELNAALSENLGGVMHLITHIIELRVPDASLRAERAQRMAQWIGQQLELEKDRLDDLVLAARVHEIGKIVMSDTVLASGGTSGSTEQLETLHQFPVFGEMLVGKIPQLKEVAVLIRHQMENFDGTGAPDHLRGKQIPIGSQILRAVNVVEAVPFGSPVEKRVAALQSARGTALEPVIMQCAVEYESTRSDPAWMKGKKQVPIGEIHEGMVIAADLVTAKGIKLLGKDTSLTRSHVSFIQAHHHTDPILSGVYVYDRS